MKRFILFVLALFFYLGLQAQINGYVFDKETGQPLPGCLVKIREINKATLTDAQGYFAFHALPHGNFTLEFSYLGYEALSKQIFYNKNKVNLKIYLSPSPIRADEVVVTGWIPGTQHSTSMKVEKINLNISRELLPTVLSSLTTVPGVDIISKGIGIGSPVIRGLSKTNIVVLNNGFRLEDYQFSENHPFFIDNFGTKNIEVIKGPSSLLYGSDAIGGVINVLWEDPASVGHLASDASLQYNSNTSGIMSSTGVKASSEKFSWGIRLGYNLQGDMHDARGTQLKNTRFLMQDTKAFLMVNNEKVSHKFYLQTDRNKLGLCVAPALSMVNDNRLMPQNFYQDLTHVFLGNKNIFFINNTTHIHLNLSYEYNDRGLRVTTSKPMPIDMRLNNINYELYIDSRKNKFTLIAGTQGWLVKNYNRGTTVFLPDYNSLNISAFALMRLNLIKNLNIITGLRYDFSKISLMPIDDSVVAPIKPAYRNLSASFGGTLHLGSHAILRFNSATAYRNPNSAELGELGIHAFRYEVGNSSLKPQKSFENDLSLHIHSRRIVADLALFHNQIKNYIFLAPTNDTAANGMKIYTYNQSNALIYGLETGMQASLTKHLTAKIIYSYLKTHDSLGQPLPLIPQNKIKAFLSYSSDRRNGILRELNISISPVYAFAYPHPAPNEQPSDDYFLLNASGSATIAVKNKSMITLFVNAYNLTNTLYSDHLSTLRDIGLYDMGRNISIGLRWSLGHKL